MVQQLQRGTAVVLIDGVDEVPENRRAAVRQWLEDLLHLYPDCRYVVTSRLAAVTDGWLIESDFVTTDLQAMTTSDIRSFIEHWHEAAARAVSDPADLAQLDRYQVTLLDRVLASRQLRSLATRPCLEVSGAIR